ncbi:hypothetical protein IU487_33680 [Nocardia puris]|uniref:hypothetical protein n=1 Tax=Nocardia puris TaxID=208602 RepID=UPI00189399B2|nr:hypothetical protein [Nocardia puris]MBF6215952.1 hypothetical protein [Nocardia puris]
MRTATTAMLAAAVLAAVVAGCGHSAEPERGGRSSCGAARFEPPYAEVDPCDAEAVMLAAVPAVFTYTPGADPARRAFEAASPLLAPDFARRARAAAVARAPVAAATWRAWRAGAVLVRAHARITADDHPPDTPVTVSRVLAVELRPADTSPVIPMTVYTSATRRHGAWLVSALEVR